MKKTIIKVEVSTPKKEIKKTIKVHSDKPATVAAAVRRLGNDILETIKIKKP